MTHSLQRIIYSSTAAQDTTYETVLTILTHAITANKTFNITGMLVFNGKYFLQYMEGETEPLNTLFNNITLDNRHHSITLIDQSPIEQRVFSAWNMGYLNSSSAIQKVMIEETGSPEFTPHTFSADQAKSILQKLSFMI